METHKPRIPPGQVVTNKFPVLHVGSIPPFDPQRWDFRVFGLVEEEVVFSYQEFMSLPYVKYPCGKSGDSIRFPLRHPLEQARQRLGGGKFPGSDEAYKAQA